MGVEPTRDRTNDRATVLKTAKPTGARTPPWRAGSARVYCATLARLTSTHRLLRRRWACPRILSGAVVIQSLPYGVQNTP